MLKLRVSASIISIVILIGLTCCVPDSDRRVLAAELPLHLEEHIDEAKIGGSEVADDVHEPVEWRFDEPQPDWKAAGRIGSSFTIFGKTRTAWST